MLVSNKNIDWETRWPNFSPREVACKCGHCKKSMEIDAAAMDKLQHLRSLVKKPIYINSAYRCRQCSFCRRVC